MLNEIIVMGRLTKDPELRSTTTGKSVANFTLAVDRDKQDAADFFDCTAWAATAEFVQRNFHKGKMALVVGSMQSKKWEDRSGSKRTDWYVNVQNIYFADDKKKDGYAQMDGGPVNYTDNHVKYDPFADVMSERMDDTYGRMPF